MKKLSIIAILSAGAFIVSCSDVKRKPSNVYMPDMAYSRAYESYAERDSLVFTTDESQSDAKIFYNNKPVAGTIARGEELPFPIAKDATGDTVNYVASKAVKSPLDSIGNKDLAEAERLYLINCGICHGKNLDGNGPLWKDGSGPYPAAPKNLIADPIVSVMPEGQMFYSVTYGKNLMGSYASQLSRKQRWMVIRYIKTKQAEAKKPAAETAAK
ncbi:MAG: quinol:cytochrome C oxidoreductase [Chitinophaga sp.]|jgi:mono/diheme cytochrome c family protein|nr:quinol:cytochrome C oxidoreductase [Chitinophaga sp.]